jgi:hypothetical protein
MMQQLTIDPDIKQPVGRGEMIFVIRGVYKVSFRSRSNAYIGGINSTMIIADTPEQATELAREYYSQKYAEWNQHRVRMDNPADDFYHERTEQMYKAAAVKGA